MLHTLDSSSKDVGNDEPKSATKDPKHVEDGPSNENDGKDKSEDDSSTKQDNTADQPVNTVSPGLNTGGIKLNTVGSSSSLQTRRIKEPAPEQGFLSAVYEAKTDEDLHTCLFACFLSQEEPKRISKALSDPVWAFDYDEVLHLLQELRHEIVLSLCLLFGNHWGDENFLFGLHKAPRAWYETLANYLLGNGFHRGKIDQTLQDKYMDEILRKFNYIDVKSASTLVDLEKPLVKDVDGTDVDEHLYRSMIGSLMYLITSRTYIMFVVCACARFQVTPKASHLLVVKIIFRYLKGKPTLGLWYSRDSPFELVTYTDSDYAGATQDRKSTTGGCRFLGNRLILAVQETN
ncbi:hypothetical protein Tco_0642472 [Tanacetum coccineum]